jgi:PAP2 superfamily
VTTMEQAGSRAALARRSVARPMLLGELAIVAVLVFVYDHVRNLATAHADTSIASARWILHAEQSLHIDIERPFNVWLSAHHWIAEISSWYYQVAHLTVTLVVLAVCYWKRPDTYRPARSTLVAINVIGLVIFWLVPVAPPRLLPGEGFIDTTILAGVANAAGSAANPYAAMPSLHLAWAAWTAVVAVRMTRTRWLRIAWICYPLVTTTVVIGTGNHYLFDVFAGVGVTAVAATMTGLVSWRGSRAPAARLPQQRH